MSLPTTLRLAPSTTPRLAASACPSLRRVYHLHHQTASALPSSSASSSNSRPAASLRQGRLSASQLSAPVTGPARRTMATNGTTGPPEGLRMQNPVVFVCDMQEKFRDAIHEFDKIVLTIEKLLKFASSLALPIHATTQNARRLGDTVPALASFFTTTPTDKTRFSMLSASGDVPGHDLPAGAQVALVGIESHICITQTALDLRNRGNKVYVIADAVSSCNRAEVVVALDRLRAEDGIVVTTSESWMYECVGDASHPAFKAMFNVVKGSMDDTRKVLEALPPGSKI